MASLEFEFPVYRPSGRIHWRMWLWLLLGAFPTTLFSGWAYAHVMAITDRGPLAILAAAFFGVIFGAITYGFFRSGRSRSPIFNRYTAIVLGTLFIWVRWVVTLLIHHQPEIATAFANSSPLGWIEIIWQLVSNEIPPERAWTAWFWPVFSWLSEALFIPSITAFIATMSAQAPFSEAVLDWAKPDFKGELFWPGGSASTLRDRLKDEGPVVLMHFPNAASYTTGDAVASYWWTLQIEGQWLEADVLARWLQLTIVENTRDQQGKVKSERLPMLDLWTVNDEDYRAVAQHVRDNGIQEQTYAPTESDSRPNPVELEPAILALEGGNYGSALVLAQPQQKHPQPEVRADAFRVCAMSYSRLQDWPQAFRDYASLYELEPSAFNALQLATTSVMGGELLRGQAWFKEADQINQKSAEMKSPQLRTAFLSALEQAGEFGAARPHLEWLASTYRSVKVTDSTFLWNYGLPFFEDFLQKSLPLLRHNCTDTELREWYKTLMVDLDEDGRAAVGNHLKQIESNH